MTFRTALATAALSLLLAGCWLADQPLMPATAREPSPISGTWSDDGDGGSTPEVFRLVARDDKRVLAQLRSPLGWGDKYMMGFDQIDEGVWLVELVNLANNKSMFELLYGDPASGEVKLVRPACIVEVVMSSPTIRKVEGDCVFSDYKALRDAADYTVEKIRLRDPAVIESVKTYRRIEG